MGVYKTRAAVRLWIVFWGEEGKAPLPVTFPDPINVIWRRNNDRTADECEVTLDARRLRGLDPRGLYSVRIEVWCRDTMDGTDLSYGRRDLRFIGFVDEPEIVLDGTTDTITLKARDYTALLIDRQVPQNLVAPTEAKGGKPKFEPKRYNLKRTYADFVQEILRDAAGELAVYETATQARATAAGASSLTSNLYIEPSVANVNLATRLNMDFWPAEGNEKLWDVLNQVSDLLGVVPTFHLDFLWIKKPSDYNAGIYHLAMGRNLTNLRFSKNLTSGVSRQVFEVRCLNPLATDPANAVIYGIWPPTSLNSYQAPVRPSGGGAGTDDPSFARLGGSPKGKQNTKINEIVTRFLVDGDYTEAQLTDIARTYYEAAARLDIQGELTTAECVDLGFEEFPTYGMPGEAAKMLVVEGINNEAAPPVGRRSRERAGEPLVSAVLRFGREATVTVPLIGGIAQRPGDPDGAPQQRPPVSLMSMANSSLLIVDDLAGESVPGGEFGDDSITSDVLLAPFRPPTSEAVFRSRKAAQSAIRSLYVMEAEHRWNNREGYRLVAKFSAVLGTDTGGPTADARTDAESEPGRVRG